MWGLVLALLVAGWLYISNASVGKIYLESTNFLLWWYVVWAAVAILSMLLTVCAALFGGGVAGAVSGGPLGALAGAALGGALSGLGFIFVLLINATFVGGAYFLHLGLSPGAELVWDTGKIALGGILLLIGLLISKSRSSD